MQALNEKERESLFYQFLIVAVVVVGVIIYAINSDFLLPIQLSDMERADMENSRSMIRNKKKIMNQVQLVDSLVDKIETSSNPQSVILEASKQSENLKSLLKNDTSQNALLELMSNVFNKAINSKRDKLQLLQKMDLDKREYNINIEKNKVEATKQVIQAITPH